MQKPFVNTAAPLQTLQQEKQQAGPGKGWAAAPQAVFLQTFQQPLHQGQHQLMHVQQQQHQQQIAGNAVLPSSGLKLPLPRPLSLPLYPEASAGRRAMLAA